MLANIKDSLSDESERIAPLIGISVTFGMAMMTC